MSEFYDAGFRPDILTFSDADALWRVRRWRMDTTGTPVPSWRREKTALWVGKRITSDGDFPVVSVSIDPSQNFTFKWQAIWRCGVVNKDEVISSEEPLFAMLDAVSGRVASIGEAVANLAVMLPESKLTSKPIVLVPGIEKILATTPPGV